MNSKGKAMMAMQHQFMGRRGEMRMTDRSMEGGATRQKLLAAKLAM